MMMIYTIGHSNHPFDDFAGLLEHHEIKTLVDVRSAPISRWAAQFDKDMLERQIPSLNLTYIYKGDLLGGRPSDNDMYDDDGFVLYNRMARSYNFQQGIEWLLMHMEKTRLAIMCSEENPAVCHRHLLIARVLIEQGIEIGHIRGNGGLESYEQVVKLAQLAGPPKTQTDLFSGREETPWRSLQSVLREKRPRPSSDY